jgi:hypothetical protein
MTLTEVIDAYLTRLRSLGMRFESAGQLLHQFSRAMGSSKIGEVTPEAVADFLRGKGALSATWQLRYKVLTGLYRFAIGRGYVGCSPLPRTLPKLPSKLLTSIPLKNSTDWWRRRRACASGADSEVPRFSIPRSKRSVLAR